MGKCWSHGEYSGSTCPTCTIEKAIKEQTESARRIHEEESRQRDEHMQAVQDAYREAAERAEEAAWEAEYAAREALAEQRRIAETTVEKQRQNIAEAWKLQAQSKAGSAFKMYKAEMYEAAIDLAKEAIGANGDPSNIMAQQVIAWALLATGQTTEAKPYFLNQIKLLNTPDYADDPFTFDSVLEGLPDDKELLSAFSKVLHANASRWNDPSNEINLLTTLFSRNLISDTKHLAPVLVKNARQWISPNGFINLTALNNFITLLTLLLDHNLQDEAKSLAQILTDRISQADSSRISLPDCQMALNALIDRKLLREAQQLIVDP